MNVLNIFVSKYFCALESNIFRTLLFEHPVGMRPQYGVICIGTDMLKSHDYKHNNVMHLFNVRPLHCINQICEILKNYFCSF